MRFASTWVSGGMLLLRLLLQSSRSSEQSSRYGMAYACHLKYVVQLSTQKRTKSQHVMTCAAVRRQLRQLVQRQSQWLRRKAKHIG